MMSFRLKHFVLLIFALAPMRAVAADEAVLLPRVIIALYDKRGEGIPTSYLHTMAEMPLNHLGLNLEYYDIHEPLPDISKRKDVLGVITWFFSDTRMDPETYLKWAINTIDSGKKFVVMGPLGLPYDSQHHSSSMLTHKFLSRIGIKMPGGWIENPFDVTYDYKTPGMFATQRPYDWTRPSYPLFQMIKGQGGISHLAAYKGKPEGGSDLIVTTPTGGYISGNYIFRTNERAGEEVNQWLINPLEFFRLAFDTDYLPKPDTTTIAGRRIYYSHIDGDGWNNITQLEEYREQPVLSAQVVMEKAVKPYPDLPVTVTIIAADIDPDWAAVTGSRKIAKEFFALPQVEAGSHTYSHPFHWQFFQGEGWRNEASYLHLYTHRTWKPGFGAKSALPATIPAGYSIPRAYASEPFEIHREIEGSLKEIRPLLPSGKKPEIITWSGNCLPWEEVIRLSRKAGLQNINGGDSRSDAEYPGYASLAPIGRPVGNERQIYASTSNENTYTNLWSENFHAHRYLVETLQNSESPIRLKPLNIYYHFYAGERITSLNALLSNLAYAYSEDIAPVTASEYTRIASGFYDTRISFMEPGMWRVDQRGDLQTIRFDHAAFKTVDFQKSKGIIGQRHYQGSLYVYLDSAVASPVIAVKENSKYYAVAEEDAPYLVESRWLISDLTRKGAQINFMAQGFGAGEMVWQMAAPGSYLLSVDGEVKETLVARDRLLKFAIRHDALKPVKITITPVSGEGHA